MNNLLNSTTIFVKRNASTILTCIGGAGVITTSILAAKATPKALRMLDKAEKKKGEDLTKLEKVKVAGPAYIPSALMGASTIACIFGANTLNKHNQAALMSAYAMLDTSYKEYQAKVREIHGEEAEDNISTEIAKDKYEGLDVIDGDGEELFYDVYSGRYFKSTMYKVQFAEYQLNRDLVMQEWATLNHFYDYLGLPPIEAGDRLGWTVSVNFDCYWQTWVDFGHNKFTLEDGTECIKIRIMSEPVLDFEDFYEI